MVERKNFLLAKEPAVLLPVVFGHLFFQNDRNEEACVCCCVCELAARWVYRHQNIISYYLQINLESKEGTLRKKTSWINIISSFHNMELATVMSNMSFKALLEVFFRLFTFFLFVWFFVFVCFFAVIVGLGFEFLSLHFLNNCKNNNSFPVQWPEV